MKNILIKINILFALLSINACKHTPLIDPNSDSIVISDFIENEEQIFFINSESESKVYGKYGTSITIPPNCFVDSNGDTLLGDIEIRLIEIVDKSSMIWYDKPTMSGEEILVSDGEFKLKALKNGEELTLNNVTNPFSFLVRREAANPNMGLFFGEEDTNGDFS